MILRCKRKGEAAKGGGGRRPLRYLAGLVTDVGLKESEKAAAKPTRETTLSLLREKDSLTLSYRKRCVFQKDSKGKLC